MNLHDSQKHKMHSISLRAKPPEQMGKCNKKQDGGYVSSEEAYLNCLRYFLTTRNPWLNRICIVIYGDQIKLVLQSAAITQAKLHKTYRHL